MSGSAEVPARPSLPCLQRPSSPAPAAQESPREAAGAFGGDTARAQGGEYNVRVAVRCRPLLPTEASERCRECVGVSYEDGSVVVGKTCFSFDHVFGTEASQERVHEDIARPLLESLAGGLNATLLAYGQTSSGKTFTLGSSNSAAVPEEQQGIIPRFVNALFRDVVYPRSSEADITLRVSFVELHNEDINDLLEPNLMIDKSRSISIRDDPQQGVVVSGVKQVDVKRPSDLIRCLDKGAVFRTTASTNMNEQSSRSHAIFTVTVEQQNRISGETLTSKVRFCDLAGSERAKKTGTVGERFREGVNINQGLLALGNVISALGDPKLNRSHVPYRDSKLTRLLQDSLGGNSRTLMIACVSPADVHFGETLNTLKYANRAKNIRNKVSVNFSVQTSDIAKLQERIQILTRDLQLSKAGADGVTVQDLLGLHQSQQQEISRLQTELKAAKHSLREAAEEALQYRAKYERCAAAGTVPPEELERSPTAGCGGGAESDDVLLRLMREAKEVRAQNVLLQERLRRALSRREQGDDGEDEVLDDGLEEEAEPGLELPAKPDMVEGGFRDFDISPLDQTAEAGAGVSFFVPQEDLTDNAEALAHVAEDQREEERFCSDQNEMQKEVQELDDVIKEKEALMDQLTKQSKVFRSMQARYELRLRELRSAVGSATEEKDQMLKEMQQLVNTKQRTPQDEGEAAMRKAHLQGRLHEVNRQLVDLQRRQGEAQRLLRLKEQQAAQIRRMQEEIDRLRGQKLVVLSRMKCEEQQHRVWRRRNDTRLRELLRKSAELQRVHRQQAKLLGKKTKEAEQSKHKVEQSKHKVEQLKREQRHILEALKKRSQVQSESSRSRKLREVNERLQQELEERERKVKQMEAILARRERLQEETSPEAAGELWEVEDNIELLDAQIDYTSECIAQSQTDILRLAAAPRNSVGGAQAEAEAAGDGASDPLLQDSKDPAGRSGEEVVARLSSLEDAKATCLACFQSLDEAQGESSRLRARTAELEAELADRAQQVEELRARQRMAEAQWASQATELQRLHLNKEVYLLSQVDRTLTETLEAEAAPAQAAQAEEAAEKPADALVRLLDCRTEQIHLLEQQTEQLQASLAEAERARDEAKYQALVARRDAGSPQRAGAEQQLREEARPEREGSCSAGAASPAEEAAPAAPEAAVASAPGAAPREAWAEASTPSREGGGGQREGGGGQREAPASVTALRAALDVEGVGFEVLEGVAQKTSQLLCGLWRDLGLDESMQMKRLSRLAEATIALCSDELEDYERHVEHMKKEHDGIQRMAQANHFPVPPELSEGDATSIQPLHKRHEALKQAAAGHLEECVARLQKDLKRLFGLPNDLAQVSQERLNELTGMGAKCALGKDSAAASLQPRDLDVLGLSGPNSGLWLQRPTLETFAALDLRQGQASSLLAELRTQLRRVDDELRRHHEALGTADQQLHSFIARRGEGVPALASSQQELQQLQHTVRMTITQGRLRLVEHWMKLSTPHSAQERVLAALRECANNGALEELKALTAELHRLEDKIRHRQSILDQRKSLSGLEDQIQDFEREASNSARLRGSSVKLLQEEQQRLQFRKRKAKLIKDMIAQVAQWEIVHGERFMHNGAALRDTLQQDLDDLLELGGLNLAMEPGAVRKSSSFGHGRSGPDGGTTPTSGAAAGQAGQAPASTAASGGAPLSARRGAPAVPRPRTSSMVTPGGTRAAVGAPGRGLGADPFGVGCTGDLGGAAS